MSLREYILKEVEKRFQDLSRKLEDQEKRFRETVEKLEIIRAALEQKLEEHDTGNDDNLPIKSTHYGGKFNNDGSGMFDIIVCLHSKTLTPIPEVLELFLEVLRKNSEITLDSIETLSTENAIQFKLKNDLKCILRIYKDTKSEIKGPAEFIRNFGITARYYASKLLAKHLEFMDAQSSLAFDIASILNYWLKSVDLKGEIFFDSTMVMELMSVYAVIDLATRKEGSVFDGFSHAVDELCKLSTLRVGFFQENGQWKNWKNVSSRHKLPFILPPLAPMENAMGGFSIDLYETLQLQALILKGRLAKLLEKREYCVVDRNHTLIVEFDRLFESTPLQIPLDFGKGNQAAAYIVIGFGKEHGDTSNLPKEHVQALEMLKNRLCDVIPTLAGPAEGTMRQFKATSSRARLNKKITMITKLFVKKSLPSILVNGVTRSDLKMEWFDFSFLVPYRQLDGMMISVGFKWNAKDLEKFEKFMFY